MYVYLKGLEESFGSKKHSFTNIKKCHVESLTFENITMYKNILKTYMMHDHCGTPFLCPMDNKLISIKFEWCIEMYPGLGPFLFKTSACYGKFMFYQCSYLYLLDTSFFPLFMELSS